MPVNNAMVGSWVVVVERFRVASGQVNDEEGTNVPNVRIWVEGAVLEYKPRCISKTPGKLSTTYQQEGGAPG